MSKPDGASLNLPPVSSVDIMGAEHRVVAANSGSCSSLVSSDDDEEIACYENGNGSLAAARNPVVNIMNSSDVVIGSVTQFHGPVTIVQHAQSPQLTIKAKHPDGAADNDGKHDNSNVSKRISRDFLSASR